LALHFEPSNVGFLLGLVIGPSFEGEEKGTT